MGPVQLGAGDTRAIEMDAIKRVAESVGSDLPEIETGRAYGAGLFKCIKEG